MDAQDAVDSVEPLYSHVRSRLINAGKVLRVQEQPDSFANYLDLINDISVRDADYLLYLGAGVTRSATPHVADRGAATFSPPGWQDLLIHLFEAGTPAGAHQKQTTLAEWYRRATLRKPPSSLELRDLFPFIDRLQLAWLITQLYVRSGGIAGRNAMIRAAVQPPSKANSPLLEQLRRLPSSTVVTTNYDNIIETHFKERKIPDAHPHRPVDLLPQYLKRVIPIYNSHTLCNSFGQFATKIYYLHGSVNYTDSTLVLDRFEYADLLANKDGLLDYVTYLLRSMPAIYVGFSLDDPDFNQVEHRLFSTDRSLRPVSYAFVPVATKTEHESWRQRNLRLIEYGDNHDVLPELFRLVAEARNFICWAEPDRPPGTDRGSDRTTRYFADALTSYVQGRFDASVTDSRAALGSTLFWGTLDQERPIHTDFYRLCRLIDIRIRLAMSHYKARYKQELQLERAKVNIAEAEALLRDASGLVDGCTSRAEKHLIYEKSLAVVKARVAYNGSEWSVARALYDKVCDGLVGIVQKLFDNPAQLSTYEDWRAIEVYGYALCQRHRIAYQWVNEPPSEVRRIANVDELLSLAESIRGLLHRAHRLSRKDGVGFDEYFESSLRTIECVAEWFAARHLLGCFADIVPTEEERRTHQLLSRVNRALEILGHDYVEKRKKSGGGTEFRVSPRWQSLRLRYFARGYVTRWFLEKGANARDLQCALNLMAESSRSLWSIDLKREYVLTQMELARVVVVGLCGEILFGEGVGALPVLQSGVGVAASHLASALVAARDMRDEQFLVSLAVRIKAYLDLLCRVGDLPSCWELPVIVRCETGSVEFRNLSDVVGESVGKLLGAEPSEALAECYDSVERGGFSQRLADFRSAFSSIARELENSVQGRRKKGPKGRAKAVHRGPRRKRTKEEIEV